MQGIFYRNNINTYPCLRCGRRQSGKTLDGGTDRDYNTIMIELDKIYNMDCLEGMRQMDADGIEKVRKKIKAEQAQLTLF